jgi:hypothetical protein
MSRYRSQRNYGCRIHDQYMYFGMRTLVLENDLIRISLLLDKGSDIYEYMYKPLGLDFIWLTEKGVQRQDTNSYTSVDPVAKFVDDYEGGWQEVFPNGGSTSAYRGAMYGQHAEVALMPWEYEIVEDTVECIQVKLHVKTNKAPFFLSKTLTLYRDSPALHMQEKLENLSGVELHYMWGHHLAFGKPFLQPGCQIKLPEEVVIITETPDSPVLQPGRVKRGFPYVWPIGKDEQGQTVDFSVLPGKSTTADIIYLTGFGDEAWYQIENHELQLGMKVSWDSKEMPYLWYWQEFGTTESYPWYGRHYNIGLEPFTSYPTLGLEEAIRNKSAAYIGPHGSRSFACTISPYELLQQK